jgi:Lrp/AsnC family leucine-responsive transcriptional regulator|tara:strand:+ start:1427 stop:1891 length:465 start_codon:yes stop_codon:yes gene_type:complete
MAIDKIDITLLNLLQNNTKLNTKELAQKVGLSVTPTYERIKRLEKQGYIKHYVAILDRKLIDKNLMVISFVSLILHSKDVQIEFEKSVIEYAEVIECFHVTGSYDYQLKVVVSDMEEYQSFIKNKLSSINNIANVQSSFVMSSLKDTTAIPIIA